MKYALMLSLILSGCGTLEIHNPYEQSISEALAPDSFEITSKRDNRQDDISGTDFKFKWDLK